MTKKTDPISNTDNMIDSRDVIARIKALQEDTDLDEDETEELQALRALVDECNHPDWKDGVTLISEGYFVTYAQELAEDLGMSRHSADWPFCHIDWDAAADSLRQDYSRVDFAGQTYWMRS